MTKLKFGRGNAKLSKSIATFSMPAGYSCPLAKQCFSTANRVTGKIKDGKDTLFRCFAASQESIFPSVRRARWHNFDLLKNARSMENMASLIQSSLPPQTSLIRVHVSGDFFNESYFLAWLNVAWNNPHITFYGYTKMLPFFVKYKKHTPANFRFTASKGGKADNLISKHRLKFAEVVYSPEEASAKGLSIDHDDSLAIGSNTSFALLLHGNQKANSSASVAWQSLIKRGIGGYGKNDKKGFRNKTMEKELVIHIALKNGEIFLPKTVDKSYNFVPTTDPKINAPLS